MERLNVFILLLHSARFFSASRQRRCHCELLHDAPSSHPELWSVCCYGSVLTVIAESAGEFKLIELGTVTCAVRYFNSTTCTTCSQLQQMLQNFQQQPLKPDINAQPPPSLHMSQMQAQNITPGLGINTSQPPLSSQTTEQKTAFDRVTEPAFIWNMILFYFCSPCSLNASVSHPYLFP